MSRGRKAPAYNFEPGPNVARISRALRWWRVAGSEEVEGGSKDWSAEYAQHDFPAGVTSHVAHRQWPLPAAPWVMRQSWHDLLFAHWRVSVDALRPRIPSA